MKKNFVGFFGREEDDDQNVQWVKPCKYRGMMKWVHQNCLQLWVFKIREENISIKNKKCSLCETEYIVLFTSFLLLYITMITKLAKRIVTQNMKFMLFLVTTGIVFKR